MFRRQCLLQLKRIATRCEAEIPRRSGKCLNSVQLIGYSGSDPLKGSTDHQPTKFSLATTQYYQSREENRLESKTQWHNVAVFKPWLQDTVNSYVRKGTRLFIQGHIDYSNYVDQEGIKRFSTSIIPDSVIILSQPVSMEEETGY
ncbi:single-stranded DNA-binding protein, mitochondrial-like [Orbicella faveolata]|uniref:single-stranded DNA-binding protein, mitochondrial-like n=1 Tax=Orbicella faveolata TaxID=48498 RepID=UPI0009E332BD|nr:single-stranded DNA-binding protein, mitochondrial-like [Orbicella faveolata]